MARSHDSLARRARRPTLHRVRAARDFTCPKHLRHMRLPTAVLLRVLPAALAVLLLDGSSLAAQSSPRVLVRGQVTEVDSGPPVAGALVEVASIGARAVADSAGRFALRLPAGTHVFTFSRLGYASLREEVEVQDGDQLNVALLRRPVVLEGLQVSADLLEQRRHRVVAASRVLDRDQITIGGYTNAAQAAMYRFGLALGCGGSCAVVRGRRQGLRVYINDFRAHEGLDALVAYPTSEIYRMEWFPSAAMIRAYTLSYAEDVGRNGRPLDPIVIH